MFPLKTTNKRTDRPPYLTYSLMLLNIGVFLWETTLPQPALRSAFYNYGVIPCEIGGQWFSLEAALDIVRSMFLHGDWLHLIGNMTFLWIFGSNIEDYYGRRVFLGLYFLGGAAAALVQSWIASALCLPMIGASGAISAILGSYLILYPGIKVRVGVPLFRVFWQTFLLPVWVVLGYWFVIQLVNGLVTANVENIGEGGVAFFAHVGGFIFGALFAFVYTLFRPAPQTSRYG